jgi:hypothetical protein
MASILETEYKKAERPYSQNELKYTRELLHKKLRLSKIRAEHEQCGHYYHVLKNSRKEKEISENGCKDHGNCSVCWKLNKTKSKKLLEIANILVYHYCSTFYETPELTYNNADLENAFYSWLYEKLPESNQHQHKHKE